MISRRQSIQDALPPNCPEAERGVLGCCLLDIRKAAAAVKAGVHSSWFYDGRHGELFQLLATMAANGGGDWLLVSMHLREQGRLDQLGGIPYLIELQNGVPSAENLDYYIPELRDAYDRRLVIQAVGRLKMLAEDHKLDSAMVLADTASLLERLRQYTGRNALPPIVAAPEFLAADIKPLPELVSGLLHQGSKIMVGGASKSYKTWTLLDLAVSVATGTPWLGFETAAGKVLYVNLEIQDRFFQRRLAELVAAKGVELGNALEIWNLRGYAADYRSLLPKIQSRIQDEQHALVVLDPTYKLLGAADENSATDITALLNTVEHLAVTTGAAVAMAAHFAKGNPAAKETIDRMSGSGVFARDPDSLLFFTRHEEDNAFSVELILRNFPPIQSFVVRWDWPLFRRAEELDPTKLRQTGGRPAQHTPDKLLECLGDDRLKTMEWRQRAANEYGISRAKFFELLKQLEKSRNVLKSAIDGRWEKTDLKSRNPNLNDDQ